MRRFFLLCVLGVCILARGPALVNATVTITCPHNITIVNATGCSAVVDVSRYVVLTTNDTANVTTSNDSPGPHFALGSTVVRVNATDRVDNSSSTCTVSVIVEPVATPNHTACAYGGTCASTYPYLCDCPLDTGGDHCCLVVDNTTCGGNGACDGGGMCSCAPGFAGLWCCPIGVNSTDACNGNGCCTSDGTCACEEEFTGTACDISTEPIFPFTRVTIASFVLPVIVPIVSVVGVTAAVMVVQIGIATAASAGAAAGGGVGAANAGAFSAFGI